MDSIDRLNQAIRYIEENLRDGIDYKEISKIMLSPVSAFQNFFYLTTGIALSEYIRKRKLFCAVNDLQNTNDKIIDIALKYGYESPDAFSVAFKRAYNVTPSAARQDNIKVEPFHRLFLEISIKYIKGEVSMNQLKKFEYYFGYYSSGLCEEARDVLREGAKKICGDENLLADALELKNKLALLDPGSDGQLWDGFENKSIGSLLFGTFVWTLAIEDTEKIYQEKNIPHDILIETLSSLAIYVNLARKRFGNWGVGGYCMCLHSIMLGRQFKLGRLSFAAEILNTESGDWCLPVPPDEYKLGLKEGDPYVHVLLQGIENLDESACLESFERAKEFFPKVLHFDFKAFGCTEWVFDPLFEKILPPDNDILKFQKLFVRTTVWENYESLNRGIFQGLDVSRDNIKDAPTDTDFRKKVVEHILSGGIMQAGGGFRLV